MKKITALALLSLVTLMLHGQERVTLSGRVTDFSGNPVDSALVKVMDSDFNIAFLTYSDIEGYYSVEVDKGIYASVYAIRVSDYRKTSLEYWAWNVPIFDDMVINPQYNNMEIYGVNAFEPQVTPHETYMIYFRPMSLKKMMMLIEKQEVDKTSFEKAGKVEKLLDGAVNELYDFAPETITPGELSVKVNGIEATIVNIEKIREYARGINLYGYLVQVLKPEEIKSADMVYDRISILLHSMETDEIGMGETFVKRQRPREIPAGK
jgi:hypothetical protein